jgi:hypothetical protein
MVSNTMQLTTIKATTEQIRVTLHREGWSGLLQQGDFDGKTAANFNGKSSANFHERGLLFAYVVVRGGVPGDFLRAGRRRTVREASGNI